MEGERINLPAPLEGKFVVVDWDRVSVGTLEDWESGKVALIRAATEALITESNIGALRDLKPADFLVAFRAINGAFTLKKAS